LTRLCLGLARCQIATRRSIGPWGLIGVRTGAVGVSDTGLAAALSASGSCPSAGKPVPGYAAGKASRGEVRRTDLRKPLATPASDRSAAVRIAISSQRQRATTGCKRPALLRSAAGRRMSLAWPRIHDPRGTGSEVLLPFEGRAGTGAR